MDKKDIKLSYETLWKFIIRPPRDNYEEDFLVDEYFIYKNKQYQRKDYDLISSEGYIMKCSFIEPIDSDRPQIEMPVILYLHGNSSSRMEGLGNLTLLLNLGINLFVFDFPGCGLSEGEYISLGYHEKNDVKIVMDFLEKIPGVGNIGIWGRSMGAATTLLYAYTDPRVKAICLDSPFERFEKLAEELVIKQINLPRFLISGALKIIKSTVKSKNGLDISKLNPIEVVEKTFQPAIFVHAINDELIKVEHSINLFNNYGGPKSLKCCDTGGHNSKRSKVVKNEIGEFFKKYLFDNSNVLEEDLMKKYINKNENNIMNNIDNNYDGDDFEEFEEEEDDTPQDNGNDINININDDMLEEDYIMNQIYESQKGEKNKNEINDNNININKINNNINKNNSNNLNKKEKKDNKNNLEEKRIEKIMQQEKDQMEQMKQALLSLNLENNNNENNNSNNINDININIKDDNENNENNENKFENSENVDLLNEEEYKNNSGNNDNLENGGKF